MFIQALRRRCSYDWLWQRRSDQHHAHSRPGQSHRHTLPQRESSSGMTQVFHLHAAPWQRAQGYRCTQRYSVCTALSLLKTRHTECRPVSSRNAIWPFIFVQILSICTDSAKTMQCFLQCNLLNPNGIREAPLERNLWRLSHFNAFDIFFFDKKMLVCCSVSIY